MYIINPIIFIVTIDPLCKNAANGFPSSLESIVANPIRMENKIKANILLLDKIPEKSLTVILETIFWIMPTFSCSIELVELRRLLNIDESKLLVGLNNLKLITPIIP